jgi:putative RNA 2'-phosphotransferase
MSQQVRMSKMLSYWLRHEPSAGGLSLDGEGWTSTTAVCDALARSGLSSTLDDIASVVATSDKQRFELSADRSMIRARQGHSVEVQGDWTNAAPPAKLFHGAVERFLPAIIAEGLQPQQRHHVHLSADIETAIAVGARRGRAIIIEVDAAALAATGETFLLSGNGVWLVAQVPPAFLRPISSPKD